MSYVSFYKNFKLITKSNSAAILLSHLVMLNSQYGNKEFYHTDEQIKDETALTRNELAGAKKVLCALGLIQTRKKKIKYYDQPVLHYLIQFDQIQILVDLLKAENQFSVRSENQISGDLKSSNKEDHEILTDKKEKEIKTKTPKVPKGDGVRDLPDLWKLHQTETEFDIFWKSWPGRKVARKKAEQAWDRLKPSLNKVLNALQMMQETRSILIQANVWVAALPNPTTWLNQERWDDEHDIDKAKIEIKNHNAVNKPKFERNTDSDMERFNRLKDMFGPKAGMKDVNATPMEVVLIN